MNNGNNNESKVTHDKGQELDCLKKISNINEKIWIKEKCFLHIGIHCIDIVKNVL